MKKIRSGLLLHRMTHVSLALVLLFAIIAFSCNTNETASVCVGLSKMNVLYRGVDNPATFSVTGTALKDVKVTINNGTIKQFNEGYIINPTKLGSAIVTVYAKDKVIGSPEFRVKDLPDPVAKVINQKGGLIEKADLIKAGGITAELDGSDFDYRFMIVSFTLSVATGGFIYDKVSRSDKFTGEQIDLINKATKGQYVRIEEIQVMGPEGSPRTLQNQEFIIK